MQSDRSWEVTNICGFEKLKNERALWPNQDILIPTLSNSFQLIDFCDWQSTMVCMMGSCLSLVVGKSLNPLTIRRLGKACHHAYRPMRPVAPNKVLWSFHCRLVSELPEVRVKFYFFHVSVFTPYSKELAVSCSMHRHLLRPHLTHNAVYMATIPQMGFRHSRRLRPAHIEAC